MAIISVVCLIMPKSVLCFLVKIYFLFFLEPTCLAELERIQVLDGGKRKFGRYLTSHLNPIGCVFLGGGISSSR